MKGDESFRHKSKAFLQSANEVFVYNSVIPAFKKFVETSGDQWVAKVYFAGCDTFPKLSDDKETILALEDLNTLGYRMTSSKIDLDAHHLKIMARKVGSYHAISFAMKLKNDPVIETLRQGLIPFHFKSEAQGDLEAYKYLGPLSFQRLFNYVAQTPKYQNNQKFIKILETLKPKICDDFIGIMENFLKVDHDFAVILHGDYYRNNVMFKYENISSDEEVPTDLRMFDFQETRFATVAIDLSIFMFMHVHANLKPLIWDELLQIYHDTLILSLMDALKCEKNDERLEIYRFEKFLEHFKKFAFYGVAVSVL